ncbi:TPA: hypothetical protein EYP37_08825, partial [Candidatus Poribacteria bacterium]|nr:hypothetical protein [Candidatus Poribacteria bacterium]
MISLNNTMTTAKEYPGIWQRRRYAKDVDSSLVGRRVVLCGWVHRKRTHGGVLFIILRDATGTIQLSAHRDRVPADVFASAERVTLESSITAEGTVVADERAPRGIELALSDLKVVHMAEPWPVQKTTRKVFLLDHRHLHLRSLKVRSVMLV